MIFFKDGHGLAQARSERRVKMALKRFSATVASGAPSCKLANIVVSRSLGRTVNLDEVSIRNAGCVLEPEQFPAAMMKIIGGDHTLGSALVFSSGKFSIAGIKRREDVATCISKLYEMAFYSFCQTRSLGQDKEGLRDDNANPKPKELGKVTKTGRERTYR